jgi:predicted alpha/beta superfamily hydrolase
MAADIKQGVAAKNITTVKFQSESLGQERFFNVLLPLDYESSTSRYPALYLLHGYGQGGNSWSYMTNLSGYAARHKLIIVMLDASNSWYVNGVADPKARFEDYTEMPMIYVACGGQDGLLRRIASSSDCWQRRGFRTSTAKFRRARTPGISGTIR